MGLSVSHGAFDASYSAFNRFRRHILRSIGGTFPPHETTDMEKYDLKSDYWYWYVDDMGNKTYSYETHPGLYELFSHSDCDGEIQPNMCKILADELESILFHIKMLEKKEPATGQLKERGGYVQVTKDFIAGCRLAYSKNETLNFL
ncbi:hypothetical protein AAGS61_05825 [Lysinibacillus sp. KU-BSD001]|uniref:hypothetical protein n=1 Tax=Lysinibacillus sp. KU-BSD001 TaxID=3141328 RepID=UPI0036EE8553